MLLLYASISGASLRVGIILHVLYYYFFFIKLKISDKNKNFNKFGINEWTLKRVIWDSKIFFALIYTIEIAAVDYLYSWDFFSDLLWAQALNINIVQGVGGWYTGRAANA